MCQPPCSPCSRHPRVVRSSMRRPRCRRVGGRLVLVLVSICRCAGALLQHMCHSHTTDRPVRARVIGYSVFLRAWMSRSTRCSWVLLTGRSISVDNGRCWVFKVRTCCAARALASLVLAAAATAAGRLGCGNRPRPGGPVPSLCMDAPHNTITGPCELMLISCCRVEQTNTVRS